MTPADKDIIIQALADTDTGTDDDHFTIPLTGTAALAERLEPLLCRARALGWTVGCDQGVKWAQGNADRPLTNPYTEEETE